MKKLSYVTLIVVVALFGLTFSYQNQGVVEIKYYFGVHFLGQLPLLLFITFAVGLVAGWLIALIHGVNARRKWRHSLRNKTQSKTQNTATNTRQTTPALAQNDSSEARNLVAGRAPNAAG